MDVALVESDCLLKSLKALYTHPLAREPSHAFRLPAKGASTYYLIYTSNIA
jgi:hypothetical protein